MLLDGKVEIKGLCLVNCKNQQLPVKQNAMTVIDSQQGNSEQKRTPWYKKKKHTHTHNQRRPCSHMEKKKMLCFGQPWDRNCAFSFFHSSGLWLGLTEYRTMSWHFWIITQSSTERPDSGFYIILICSPERQRVWQPTWVVVDSYAQQDC